MADFQISITNPTTAQVDITDQNDVLTIVDHSNYDDASPEAGHNQADFDTLRRLKITLPSGTTYLFSSLYAAEGDITLAVPAGQTLPLSTQYAYNTGDGKYTITLYVLPTWDTSYSYLVSTAPYVWYDGVAYKCLQDGSAQQPDGAPTYWEVVADLDDLTSKYRLEQNITVYSDMKEVWARLVYISNCVNNKVGCRFEDLLRDPAWVDSVRLCLMMDSIPVLMKVDAWDEIDTNINQAKVIAAKYGY